MAELPEYPLFTPTDAEAALGAKAGRYAFGPGWDAAKAPSREICRALPGETKAVRGLMSRGGSLAQYGFKVRPELDAADVRRALSSLMRSWDVSHEQKEATVALAIHRWCDAIPAEQAA